MDPRERPQPPPPPRLQPQPSSAPPNMMVPHGSFSSSIPNPIPSSMINPNSSPMLMAPATARIPFSSLLQQSRSPPPPPSSEPSEPLSTTAPCEGSSSALRPCGLGIGSKKRKRGQPKKFFPDDSIDLGLAPTPISSSGPIDLSASPSEERPAKRKRGRPPGSGKKQLDALGVGGTGFTPHVILMKTGEDILAKLMAFRAEGQRSFCIISAHGAVSNVSLRQPGLSGTTMHHEGRYEIISMSGSFQPNDNGGCRTGGLSVSLAAGDGKLVGGAVTGMLIAASQVQLILGSFILDRKKASTDKEQKPGPSSDDKGRPGPSSAAPANFGALSSLTPASAASQGQGGSSESSDDDDSDDSPVQRGTGIGPSGGYNNTPQPIRNVPWHQIWANQTQHR